MIYKYICVIYNDLFMYTFIYIYIYAHDVRIPTADGSEKHGQVQDVKDIQSDERFWYAVGHHLSRSFYVRR